MLTGPHNINWLTTTVKEAITQSGFELNDAQLKALKKSYDKLPSADKQSFKRYFLYAYGRYSGKLINAQWAFHGGILLTLLDVVINHQSSTFRLVCVMAMGSFMGFMAGRRTSAFFRSGDYYAHLKQVNDTFKKVDHALQLNSFFLRFAEQETVGISVNSATLFKSSVRNSAPAEPCVARRRSHF